MNPYKEILRKFFSEYVSALRTVSYTHLSHILHIGDTVFFGTKAAYLNEFPQAWQKGGEVK